MLAVVGSGDGAIFALCCKIIANVWAAARTFACDVVVCPSGDNDVFLFVAPIKTGRKNKISK